ncbi:MAG: membrane protein insertase YidC [Candidatus Neomarinimicrobiota bacterium]
MDKKTVAAFFLIALILMAMPYYYEFLGLAPSSSENIKEPKTIENPSFLENEGFSKSLQYDSSIPQNSFGSDLDEFIIFVDSPIYIASISSRNGGSITSFLLKDYLLNDTSFVNLVDRDFNDDNLLLEFTDFNGNQISLSEFWSIKNSFNNKDTISIDSPFMLSFSSSIMGQQARKSLTFYPNNYTIKVSMDLQKISDKYISQERFTLNWNGGITSTEPNKKDEASFFAANLSQGKEISKHGGKHGKVVSSTGRTDWAAVRSKYFTAAIIPISTSNYGVVRANENTLSKATINQDVPVYNFGVGFSSAAPAEALIYLGPLQYDSIKALGVGLENTLSLGLAPIRFIGRAVLLLLVNLHSVIPNYGIVLIVFSVIIKILVYPLTKKSYQSMKDIQTIQPEVTKLREKFKSDPQKLNQATMNLYKEHGVNPLGGCLPMLLQMPLLFALFIVFRSTIELRGAPFIFWISDLSQPDALIPLPFSLPLYGDQISLLPLLMGVSMFVQQKMTTSQANPQQKMMTQFMSVFFIILFNQFPSGLNLYYTLFNVLTILQQKYLVQPKDIKTAP